MESPLWKYWKYTALALVTAGAVGCAARDTAALPSGATSMEAGTAARDEDHTGGFVGKTAEGFTLPGLDGKTVDVGTIIGEKPVVLVFYRGVW